jgi:hypothetical protein
VIFCLLLPTTSHGNPIWKYVLRSKGLYRITLGKELELTDDENKVKWANKSDEARGLIGMSISFDLRFHLQGIDAPMQLGTKLEAVFGKHNII